MLKRQTTGSVVCVSCGYLVGVRDERCYNCGRRNPGLWGFAASVRRLGNDLGFTPFVIGTCVTVYVLTLLAAPADLGMHLGFGQPNPYALLQFGASGFTPVFLLDRWWTVLSAVWLHGSAIHILLNMMFVRNLAPAVGELYGPGRMVILYTIGGIAGFLLSSVIRYFTPFGAVFSVGASGAVFGLLGALVYYGRRTGSSHVHSQAMSMAITNIVLGFMFPGIDNFAHIGGFIGGFGAGMVLDPLKPERIDHMVAALVCIALSVVSILVSYLVPIGLN
jgi:rhomboid protease GluP